MITTKKEMDKAVEKQLLFRVDNPEKFTNWEVWQAKDKLILEFGHESPRHPGVVDREVGLAEKYNG